MVSQSLVCTVLASQRSFGIFLSRGDSLQMSPIDCMELFCRLTQMHVMCVYGLTIQPSLCVFPLNIWCEIFVIDFELISSSLLVINYLEVQCW